MCVSVRCRYSCKGTVIHLSVSPKRIGRRNRKDEHGRNIINFDGHFQFLSPGSQGPFRSLRLQESLTDNKVSPFYDLKFTAQKLDLFLWVYSL